jgi:hypothetical protein
VHVALGHQVGLDFAGAATAELWGSPDVPCCALMCPSVRRRSLDAERSHDKEGVTPCFPIQPASFRQRLLRELGPRKARSRETRIRLTFDLTGALLGTVHLTRTSTGEESCGPAGRSARLARSADGCPAINDDNGAHSELKARGVTEIPRVVTLSGRWRSSSALDGAHEELGEDVP